MFVPPAVFHLCTCLFLPLSSICVHVCSSRCLPSVYMFVPPAVFHLCVCLFLPLSSICVFVPPTVFHLCVFVPPAVFHLCVCLFLPLSSICVCVCSSHCLPSVCVFVLPAVFHLCTSLFLPLSSYPGLALLLPYLISQNKHWKNCKLRIFTGGSSRQVNKARLRYTDPMEFCPVKSQILYTLY